MNEKHLITYRLTNEEMVRLVTQMTARKITRSFTAYFGADGFWFVVTSSKSVQALLS